MAARPLPFTLEEFKGEMLTGIPLTFTDRAGNIVTYPDTAITRRIVAAVNTLERELQIDLFPRKVITRAHVLYPELVQSVDYDIDEDPQDYEHQGNFGQGYFRMRRWPILSLEKIELRFPEETVIFTFPGNWLRVYHQSGQIHIMAIASGNMPAIITREGGFLPLFTGALHQGRVAQLVYANYTSGIDFLNPNPSAIGWPGGTDTYEDLKLALMQQAAVAVLLDLSRGYAAGIASESLSEDGQSESVSYARGPGGIFSQEIEGLKAEIKIFVDTFKKFRKGIIFDVL